MSSSQDPHSLFYRLYRRFLTFVVAIGSTVFWGILLLILGTLERLTWARGLRVGWFGAAAKRLWAQGIGRPLGVRVKLHGPYADRLHELKSMILVSNHQSLLDILAVLVTFPGFFHFIAKKELKSLPFFGQGAAIVGTVFIDRQKGTQNQGLRDAEDAVKKGHSIILFPEGTRSTDGQLLPFKRGAFVMAISLKVPIVPMVITGSRELCPKGKLSVMPGEIQVWVGEPISTTGLSIEDRHRLSDQLHSIISKQLVESFGQRRENKSVCE